MKILLFQLYKSKLDYLNEGYLEYENRLKHYTRFETISLGFSRKVKFSTTQQQKQEEAKLLFGRLKDSDVLVLLDNNGKQYSSTEFANQIQKWKNSGISRIIFVIGGPFGFDADIYNRANYTLSLSKMTLTHQMVRLFFVEQLYRAHTIIKGEKYHH